MLPPASARGSNSAPLPAKTAETFSQRLFEPAPCGTVTPRRSVGRASAVAECMGWHVANDAADIASRKGEEHAAGDTVREGGLVAGRYRIIDGPLYGGMGEIWQARDEQLGRTVALKRAREAENPKVLRRLRKEATVMASLAHPHTVTLYDVALDERGGEPAPDGPSTDRDPADGDSADRNPADGPGGKPVYWLVMEYAPGGSLAQLLAEQGSLPPKRAAEIGAAIAGALAAVHARGIVHGDVKPGNILITEGGVPKLADFGTARNVEQPTVDRETAAHTPGYAAPEVLLGRRAQPASDVFSLGMTVYEMLHGERPRTADAGRKWRRRRARRQPVPGAADPGSLGGTVDAMLRRRPRDRPSAAKAQELLEKYGRGAGTRRLWWVAAAVALCALVGGGIVWALAGREQEPGSGRTADPGPAGAAAAAGTEAHVGPLLGEPSSVDPCALLDPADLTGFGDTELDPAYGGFNRCDVLVQPAGQQVVVDVQVLLDASEEAAEMRPDRTEQGVGVVELPPEPEECDRALLLPEVPGVLLWVMADYESEPGGMPLCEMADAAVARAVDVVAEAAAAGGELPRRELPRGSLGRHDACTLLDPAALGRVVPGVDAEDPDIGFGNWRCGWSSTTEDLDVELAFDQGVPPDGDAGRPTRLRGHEAYVSPGEEGPDSCVVLVPYRSYPWQGSAKAEVLWLLVRGDRPVDELCEGAGDLAGVAAGELFGT